MASTMLETSATVSGRATVEKRMRRNGMRNMAICFKYSECIVGKLYYKKTVGLT